MVGINALSLFDGMSCFQIALDKLNVKVENYYASEIDKYAIKVAMANYPDTIQLGSVLDLDTSTLPRIDILCGGSPCQSFSFAGKRKGMSTKCSEEVYTLERYLELKADGYAFEGQSYLFWEYMRVLTELRKVNPDILFLLENVEMGEKWERVLSKAIGVNGIHINSALLSAQSRKRIYWTNIGLRPSGLFGDLESTIPQPKDKGILLKDILEGEVDEKYFLSEKMLNYFRSRAASFNNGKVNIRDEDEKATCLTSSMASCDISDNFIKVDTKLQVAANQDKSNCFTAGGNSGGMHSDMDLILQPDNRQTGLEFNGRIRRLTPTECEALQTVPREYTAHVSDTQRYRMLGNGFTADVIAHILSFANLPTRTAE
jgi:DNA (cytosine-5)-methyltransferase 3A